MKKLFWASFLFLFCGSAFAHDYWLTVDNYFPKPNTEITVNVCYGHKFPAESMGSSKSVDKILLVEPDGKVTPITFKTQGEKNEILPIKVKMTKEGTNYIVLVRKPGFTSHTTKGYINQPKNELEGVLESSYSEGCRIAAVAVGKASGTLPKSIFGQDRFNLEVGTDLGNIKVGDTIPVKLFLDNKPYRTILYATYDGFSEEKDTYAYATRIPSGDFTGKIKVTKPGLWIIVAKDDIPYSDLSKADKYSFGCNITFMVK
jgi:uncharacterized GH25 family protein